MDNERIEVEAKLAWLENYVRELDEVVRTMAGELESLRAELKEVRASQASRGEPEDEDPGYEKPPHY